MTEYGRLGKAGYILTPGVFILILVLNLTTFTLPCAGQASMDESVPLVSDNETSSASLNSQSLRQAILYRDVMVGSLVDQAHRPDGMPLLSTYSDSAAPDDPWFAMDKFQHAAFSFFITTGTQYGLVNKLSLSEGHALPLSIGTSAVAGVSKEVYDMKRSSNPYFSYRDLIADGAGILLAVGLILI